MARESSGLEAELPAELIQGVFRCLDLRSLMKLMTANKRISAIACTVLYQSIVLDLNRARFASCMNALSNSEHSKHVRRLRVEFGRKDPDGPSSILLDDEEGAQLIRCLKHLPNLQHLTLDTSLFDTAKSLNDVFPFRLVEFSTTLMCDNDLLAFVEGQSTLQELGIDSTIEPSSLSLDSIRLPEIRVLRWGHEPNHKPAALEFIKTVPSIQDIHVIFPEPEMMENAMDSLKYWKDPERAFFTILFGCDAMSLASSGIEGLNHLSLAESVEHPGCFNSIAELQLRNYPSLRTLKFRCTEATWRNFEAGVELGDAIRIWFIECLSLETVTFDIIGGYEPRRQETRPSNLETRR